MVSRLHFALAFAGFTFAGIATATAPDPPAEAEFDLEAEWGMSKSPSIASPTWTELRGTTFEFDERRWDVVPVTGKELEAVDPGHVDHRIFRIHAPETGAVIVFRELGEPAAAATAEKLLEWVEARPNQFKRFERASADAATRRIAWPAGWACRNFDATAQDGYASYYSHCVSIGEHGWTALIVTAPHETNAQGIDAINTVLATVHTRVAAAPATFRSRPFPASDAGPLQLRLPERFEQVTFGGGSGSYFCEGADVRAVGTNTIARDSQCVIVESSSGPSGASGPLPTAEFEALGGNFQGRPFTMDKRDVHGLPALVLAFPGDGHVLHVLMVASAGHVLTVRYKEPKGAGAEGYDAIWRELLGGL
jgi:hypothetical protein